MGFVRKGVVVRQLLHLGHRRRLQARLAISDAHGPEPGQPINVLLTLAVPKMNPLTALYDHRALRLVQARIGVRMQHRGSVAVVKRIGCDGHDYSPIIAELAYLNHEFARWASLRLHVTL